MKTSILNKSFQQFSSIFLAVKQDCVVSPWSDWGPCSPRCGIGFRRRTRTVTFRPMNGGRECPPLIENSGCFTKLCGGKELGKEASGISSFFMLCLLLGKQKLAIQCKQTRLSWILQHRYLLTESYSFRRRLKNREECSKVHLTKRRQSLQVRAM